MAACKIEYVDGKAKARYYKQLKNVDLDCCPYQNSSDDWKKGSTK